MNNKLKDGDFAFFAKPFGWEVTGGTIDDPLPPDAVTIGIEAGAGIGGGNALKVSKLGNANTNAGVSERARCAI